MGKVPPRYSLDKSQASLDIHGNHFSQDVWSLKYKRRAEKSISDTLTRVVDGVMAPGSAWTELVYNLMFDSVFIPGGRILAGAGLPEHDSTLMNCYVMGVLDDSLQGIMDCLRESAITAKYGGGIGIDFSPLRPKGAPISTAAYFAGGPVAFMGLWDAMGHAMEAGGNRRGGKMGVLSVSHPDIIDFIEAKVKGGKLTGFNISVLITDEFMAAVEADAWWYFTHASPPRELVAFEDGPTSVDGFIWDRVRARELWDRILQTTYLYSEPGVIFIDRVNSDNPLWYREKITATNPCGEQPLPPYGACNLGSINLARCVVAPFTSLAQVDYELIKAATRGAIRFLNGVLDATKWPLPAQAEESEKVRRIGLGITGLADLLAQLGVSYASEDARQTAAVIMGTIANTAYQESAAMADELGTSFGDYIPAQYEQGVFYDRLSPETQAEIEIKGLYNGLLLSIAPTGTISAVFGDVSSGCEPHFSHRTQRKIKVKDVDHNDTWADYFTYSYAVRMMAEVKGITIEEAYSRIIDDSKVFPTAQNLAVGDHVKMVGSLQYWVDSAISKTTNCPSDMDFTEFRGVYEEAYRSGCKGCTTYRPRADMGAVLISGDVKPKSQDPESKVPHTAGHENKECVSSIKGDYKRGYELSGRTYKIRWPDLESPIFVTINHDNEGHPVEIFIASRNSTHNEWTVLTSVLISKLLQTGVPLEDVARQLKLVNLSTSTSYDNGRHYGSLVSRIGFLLEDHGKRFTALLSPDSPEVVLPSPQAAVGNGDKCDFCGSHNVRKSEGCLKCDDCGQSKCN